METDPYNVNINYDKLVNNAERAMERESKYWRENDAKFRAVNQKVATYDEFKNIVAASHLKPLKPNESIVNVSQNENGRNTKWNHVVYKDNTSFNEFQNNSKHNHTKKPSQMNAEETYLHLHQMFTEKNKLQQYHVNLPDELLYNYCCAICKIPESSTHQLEIDFDIFNYIIQHVKRLSLTLAFMNIEQLSVVKQAIDKIVASLNISMENSKMLYDSFKVNSDI